MSPGHLAAVAAAGLVAGAVNSVAGGGSLVSFPALLALGYPALSANVTNTVGLLPGYLGATGAYRRELAGQRRRVLALSVTAALGAGLGCALLLSTPAGVFRRLVPYLVLAGCAALVVAPGRARRPAAGPAPATPQAARQPGLRSGGAPGPGTHLAALAAGCYGSYFGAALGVLLLGLLGLLVREDLQRLNALKSVLSAVVAVVGAGVYALAAPVAWAPAAALAGSSLVGGHLGGLVARRLPVRLLRAAVVAAGVSVAAVLLLR